MIHNSSILITKNDVILFSFYFFIVKSFNFYPQGHSSYITHLDWSPDNKFIMSNSGDYEILYCKWTTATSSLWLSFSEKHSSPIVFDFCLISLVEYIITDSACGLFLHFFLDQKNLNFAPYPRFSWHVVFPLPQGTFQMVVSWFVTVLSARTSNGPHIPACWDSTSLVSICRVVHCGCYC